MTAANTSLFQFRQATTGSPATYVAIEEALAIGGVGQTNDLIQVSNFDSGNFHEYIAGKADGQEVTLECNYVSAGAEQLTAIANAKAGITLNYQLAYTGASPELTWSFAAVAIGWDIVPSPTEQNKIQFTFKITGAIT